MNNVPAGIVLDPWVTGSLLQKAIRRGEGELAQWAALRFHRQRGSGIWRRLAIIAFEDIGIGDLTIVEKTATMASDRHLRSKLGSDCEVIAGLVADLAAAPKDRSADYLICPARQDPNLEPARVRAAAMSPSGRIAMAIDPTEPLLSRAVAAWYAAGFNGVGRVAYAHGDVARLIEGFQTIGAPASLASATAAAARITQEPITLMLPILWMALQSSGERPSIADLAVPATRLSRGVPLYALDKHTAAGKRALGIFVAENSRVGDIIGRFAPDFRAREVAAMAAYYVDAAPVARRLMWSQSTELEQIGLHSDMLSAGCPADGVMPIVQVVGEELDHLNAIRFRLLEKSLGAGQGVLVDRI